MAQLVTRRPCVDLHTLFADGDTDSQTVNINCTFDAGYSFVGYTLDPLALKQARIFYIIYIYIYIYIYYIVYILFVGYTLDPLALKQARGIYVTLYAAQHMF